MTYSGSGNVTAAAPGGRTTTSSRPARRRARRTRAARRPTSRASYPGRVALIQRGTCNFYDKALNAQTAGASAVVIFNEGQPGRTDALAGTLGAPDFHIPVIGMSFAVGQELHGLLGVRYGARQDHDRVGDPARRANVLAETPWRRPEPRHRPGLAPRLGDPPARASTTTARARRTTSSRRSRSRMSTSRRRTRSASPGGAPRSSTCSARSSTSTACRTPEFAKILANLNFDMIASPNFVRFVYDGDGSDTGTAGPAGSARSSRSSSTGSTRRGSPPSRPRSTAAPTTGRSSTAAPPPAACSPAPRASRRPRRRRCTAASPAWRTTPATTRPATRSAT